MSEFRARIGRIRMKNGGADVRVLDRQAPNQDGEDWRGKVIDSARKIASFATDENPIAGYVVVGFYADGSTAVGWRYDPDTMLLPRLLLPHWISEVIRRDLLMEREAREVFNEMFEWRE